jgi:hypothetical protein
LPIKGAHRPSPANDQPAHDDPHRGAHVATAPLNGISPRSDNPRRGFDLMKTARFRTGAADAIKKLFWRKSVTTVDNTSPARSRRKAARRESVGIFDEAVARIALR